jgi:hypothetical protein
MPKPELTRIQIAWNLTKGALGCLLILSLFQLERGVAGMLDDECSPKYPFVFVSWVAPSYFWEKQANYFGTELSIPSEPPSVEAAKLEGMVAQAGAKERALVQHLNAEQGVTGDTAQGRVDALRAEADRIERARNWLMMDQFAADEHRKKIAHAQQCFNRAKSNLAS